jgi:hypothetical protein
MISIKWWMDLGEKVAAAGPGECILVPNSVRVDDLRLIAPETYRLPGKLQEPRASVLVIQHERR